MGGLARWTCFDFADFVILDYGFTIHDARFCESNSCLVCVAMCAKHSITPFVEFSRVELRHVCETFDNTVRGVFARGIVMARGCWLLAVGCWLSAGGCWLLAVCCFAVCLLA